MVAEFLASCEDLLWVHQMSYETYYVLCTYDKYFLSMYLVLFKYVCTNLVLFKYLTLMTRDCENIQTLYHMSISHGVFKSS